MKRRAAYDAKYSKTELNEKQRAARREEIRRWDQCFNCSARIFFVAATNALRSSGGRLMRNARRGECNSQ